MPRVLWLTFFLGLGWATVQFGSAGRIIYLGLMWLAITLFRRPLVIGLTHLFTKLGMTKEVTRKLPAEIHLQPAPSPSAAARPIVDALASYKFCEAGAFDIIELPQIQVTLMVKPEEGVLAAIESADPIGAHLNLHTVYADGRVVTYTNTQLPVSPARTGAIRMRLPRYAPGALYARARGERPKAPTLPIDAASARALYERLYADEIRAKRAAAT